MYNKIVTKKILISTVSLSTISLQQSHVCASLFVDIQYHYLHDPLTYKDSSNRQIKGHRLGPRKCGHPIGIIEIECLMSLLLGLRLLRLLLLLVCQLFLTVSGQMLGIGWYDRGPDYHSWQQIFALLLLLLDLVLKHRIGSGPGPLGRSIAVLRIRRCSRVPNNCWESRVWSRLLI